MRLSKRLILSYVFDWIVIILFAVVGALFSLITPNHRAFDLADPDISFPFAVKETISTSTLVLVGLVAPAIITLAISLTLVPGPTVSKSAPKSHIWKRKLWEWNTAWMGLALAIASAFLITQGMKLLFGKPRPDLLSRCQPDLNRLNDFVVGGLGARVREGTNLVSWHICQQKDAGILSDGFMSFPSGHSSFSWAGMTFLCLFICSKFAITIPYLLPGQYVSSAFHSHNPEDKSSALAQESNSSSSPLSTKDDTQSTPPIPLPRILRSQAAAPPVYLLVLAIIPPAIATYICATRYTDYRHHGFDIIFGTLIGFWCAYGSFRWYHAPIRRGAGWSWGPRSKDRAWAVGVGVQGYAGEAEWKQRREADLERGEGGASSA